MPVRSIAALILCGFATPALAAGVQVQSFTNMAEFQSSALYAYINGAPGGPAARGAMKARGVRQGGTDVPANSAGLAGNAAVTAEISAAVSNLPDVFSLNSTSAFYAKRFVSLGTQSGSANPPFIDLELTPVATGSTGGFNGYDLVVFDLGKNLVDITGNHNTEATTFQVQLVAEGQLYQVGSITGTGGHFINAISSI